jgi:hypothetical protein
MTTKVAIISTIGVVIGVIVLGFAILFLFMDPQARNANERASMLGQGLAMLCMIPLGGIWITWAARFRKEREQRQRSRKTRR